MRGLSVALCPPVNLGVRLPLPIAVLPSAG